MDKQKTILIVDDEESLLQVLTKRFIDEGFLVLGAKDGAEGLTTALKSHPDVILLDILMPVMDGMTVLKKLRQDSWGKNVPVILLTNLTDSAKKLEALEYNTDFLIKSDWKLNDVVKKVRQKLV